MIHQTIQQINGEDEMSRVVKYLHVVLRAAVKVGQLHAVNADVVSAASDVALRAILDDWAARLGVAKPEGV